MNQQNTLFELETPSTTATNEAHNLIQQGALVVANHSGGKDSQAMLIKLLEIVPPSQILVVHATLGESEWPGALEHAEAQARAAGVEFIVAKAGKTFLSMVETRFETRPEVPSWPSASHRQCTSDLKRGPIEREVRRFAREHGFTTIINCMGLRAEESARRAKAQCWKLNEGNSLQAKNYKNGRVAESRDWYDWLPIHEMSLQDVLSTIKDAGQELHPAYGTGNERLSCVFCIMASQNDLKNGALQNPELYRRYVALEKRTGYTMHQSRKSLEEMTGILVSN